VNPELPNVRHTNAAAASAQQGRDFFLSKSKIPVNCLFLFFILSTSNELTEH
jgi:hypothetical protein